MRTALSIAWLDWRILRRDPVAAFVALVVPFLLVVVMVPIYVEGDGDDGSVRLGVVLEGDGPLSVLYLEQLDGQPGLSITRFDGVDQAASATRRQDVAAAVIVPADLDRDVGTSIVEMIGPPDAELPSGVRALVEHASARTSAIIALARASDDEAPIEARLEVAAERAAPVLALDASTASEAAQRRNDAAAAAVIGVLVMFTFINTAARSSLLAGCEQFGVLTRARALGAPSTGTAFGFTLSLAVYAVIQAWIILGGSALMLDVDWGRPGPLLLATTLVGLSAASLATLLGSLLTNPISGVTIAAPIAFILAMLGGSLWPLEIVGPVLQTIGHLTPHAWAINGLSGVVADEPLSALAINAGVLIMIASFAVLVAAIPIRSRVVGRG